MAVTVVLSIIPGMMGMESLQTMPGLRPWDGAAGTARLQAMLRWRSAHEGQQDLRFLYARSARC